VLDHLSLYFYINPLETSTIDAVPTDYKNMDIDWNLEPDGSNAATLEPYPFRRDPLEISILTRRIPKKHYSDDADLRKTLNQAPYFALKYTLQTGSAHMQTRSKTI